MAKFCGNCGKPLEENDKVCGNCGTPVAVDELVPPTAQNRAVSNAANGKKAALIGVALLAVIVLAVVLIKAASGTTPKLSTSSTSNAPSSSAGHQIAANSSTPDGEPTPIPAAKKETLEERARKAIKELDVWDGSVAESFDGGDGSAENPYQIANGAQLAKLATDTNAGIDFAGNHFVLTSDIMLNDIGEWDFNADVFSNIERVNWDNQWKTIGLAGKGSVETLTYAFSGEFDGASYTIWGINDCLFGRVSGSVSNVTVACSIARYWFYYNTPLGYDFSNYRMETYGGTIAACLDNGSITNCHSHYVMVSVNGSNCSGGICGGIYNESTLSNCTARNLLFINRGVNTGTNGNNVYIGGIVGVVIDRKNVISNCYSDCDINWRKDCALTRGDSTCGLNIGGICGSGSNIISCFSESDVTVEVTEYVYEDSKMAKDGELFANVGGIVGQCTESVVNCGNTGKITFESDGTVEESYIGGLVGALGSEEASSEAAISFSYHSGNIESEIGEERMGGLVGMTIGDVSITHCCYNDASMASAVAITEKNHHAFTNQVLPLNAPEEFLTETNYSGWDFENVWVIDDKINNGLPIPRSLLEILG